MPWSDKQLGYARAIVTVGKSMGITDRGITIALATSLVETNLCNYANRAVPGSLTVPYDAIGSDSKSVGIMQQQPQWWGRGDGIDLMDAATAARLFFQQLQKLDYNNLARSPGKYAQDVQRSSFPDRYDQRMNEASELFRMIGGTPLPDYGITKQMHGYRADTPANATGNSNGPRARTDYVVIHTQEGDGTAESLANYLNSHDVSYNLVVDDQQTVEVVPVGEGPWAAAEANDVGVHICIAGSFASWSRSQWMQRSASLRRAAKAVAAACSQYNVPVERVRAGAGWPASRGIAAHADFGARGGGHHDPGPDFPYDMLLDEARNLIGAPNTGGDEFMAALTDAEQRELLEGVRYIRDQLGPGQPDWPSLGHNDKGEPLTLRDAIADSRHRDGDIT